MVLELDSLLMVRRLVRDLEIVSALYWDVVLGPLILMVKHLELRLAVD